MAQDPVLVGSAANDGTGDPLRTAFGKINGDIAELFGLVATEGTTANGRYIKFASGLMICWSEGASLTANSTSANGALFQSAETTWTLPATFLNTNYTVTGGALGNAAAIWVSARPDTTTAAKFVIWSAASLASRSCNLVAIGRWV